MHVRTALVLSLAALGVLRTRYSDATPANIVELEAAEVNGKITFKPAGQFFPLTGYGMFRLQVAYHGAHCMLPVLVHTMHRVQCCSSLPYRK